MQIPSSVNKENLALHQRVDLCPGYTALVVENLSDFDPIYGEEKKLNKLIKDLEQPVLRVDAVYRDTGNQIPLRGYMARRVVEHRSGAVCFQLLVESFGGAAWINIPNSSKVFSIE